MPAGGRFLRRPSSEKTVEARLSRTFGGARFACAEVAAHIVDASKEAGLE
jgi:hypothetical protein